MIEEEATPDQLASVGAHGLYGLYQGIPRTRLSADAAPIAEQDHDLPRAARPRTAGRRSSLAAAVTDTVYHEIAHHFGISDERLHELKRRRAASAAQQRMSPSTTGSDPLHPQRVLGAARVQPVGRDERPVARRAERQVEDVDARDRRGLGRAAPSSRWRRRSRRAAGADRRSRRRPASPCSRGRDGDDPVGGQSRQERVEDPLDVRARSVAGGTPRTTSLTPMRTLTNSGRRRSSAGSSCRIRSAEV